MLIIFFQTVLTNYFKCTCLFSIECKLGYHFINVNIFFNDYLRYILSNFWVTSLVFYSTAESRSIINIYIFMVYVILNFTIGIRLNCYFFFPLISTFFIFNFPLFL